MVVHGYVDQMIGFVETDGFAVLRQAARDGDVFAEGILGGAKGFGFKQCLASGEKALAVGLNLVAGWISASISPERFCRVATEKIETPVLCACAKSERASFGALQTSASTQRIH